MARSELVVTLGLVGRAIVQPARTLRAVEERARGGTLAVALLVFVAYPISRASRIEPHPLDGSPVLAVLERIGAMMLGEAAIAVSLAAGALLLLRWRVEYQHRRPRRDVQLAAACSLPALWVRLVSELPPDSLTDTVPAGSWLAIEFGWTFALAVLLVRLARGREPERRLAWSENHAARGTAATPRWGDVISTTVLLLTTLAAGAVDLHRNAGRNSLRAPPLTLARVDSGASIDLRDLEGNVVVLDFWTTWCPPCHEMAPRLEQAHVRWQDHEVKFLGIVCDAEDTPPAEIAAVVTEFGSGYPHLRGTPLTLHAYRIEIFPTIVILRRDGAIDRVVPHVMTGDELDAAIEHALTE